MHKIKILLSSTTILPSLLMSNIATVQAAVVAPPVPSVMVLAENAGTPTEEELRRRQEAEKLKHQQPAAPPTTPPVHVAPPPQPIQPAVIPHPAAPPVQPAVTPHPATPPTQPAVTPHLATPPVQPPVTPSVQPKVVSPPPPPTHVAPVQPTQPAVTPHINTPQPGTNPPTSPVHIAPATPVVPVQPPTQPAVTPQVHPIVTPQPGTNPQAPPVHVAPATPVVPVQPPTQPAVTPHIVTPQPGTNPPTSPVHIAPATPVVPVQPPPQPVTPQVHPIVTPQPGLQPRPVAPNAANQPSTMAPQFPPQPQQPGNQPKPHNGITPLEAGAIGLAAGVVGGMIIGQQVHGLGEVQTSRRTIEQNGATFYSEPGRVIVREGDGLYVRHDETERFREFGSDVHVEQRGDQTIQIVNRPDGSKIITITDANGQLLKRLRRLPNGAEVVLIDNSFRPRPQHFSEEIITVAPPPMTLAPDQYDLDAGGADEGRIYDTLVAPPLAPLPRRYTLDEIRYSRDLRQYMRSVELNSITFSTGSWALEDGEIGNLTGMADAINRAIRANPNEIFLVEGHTDAVGADVDNLSLSDRRAQTVAAILTRNFNVPPENLTTQGYGSQFLKIQTDGPERQNRRVTVRRVTPLLAGR